MKKSSGLLNLRRIFLDLMEALTVLSLVFSGKLLLEMLQAYFSMKANRKYLAFSSPDPPPATSSRTLIPSTEGSWHGWGGVGGQCCTKGCQGSYPFSETNFQDFSRTRIDFSRALKYTLTPTLPRSQC